MHDKISQYIERQFPAFYREEGQNFIAFMKAYYEWLELPENAIYKSRHLLEYRDVDTTLDEFIVYFKEKYLKNIQFNTSSNKKLLIKNASDLYRSKGTERSVDLFFKLVYGVDAEVQYPAEKIFKLSDGTWEVPRYMEITYNKQNVNYVGKQIIGSFSGAKAFVEKYIRRRAGYGIVDLVYISGLSGNFRKGDTLGIYENGVSKFSENSSSVIGSISNVFIIDKGREFAIGDIVNFEDSERGVGGQARVTQIGEQTGIVDFILEDGLWGYSTNAVSLVSEKVLIANNIFNNTFVLMDTIVQPSVFIEYQNSASFSNGSIVRSYNGSNVVANGIVIDVDHSITSNSGTAVISVVSGPFENGTYQLDNNVSTMNVISVTDFTTYAEIMGVPTTFYLTVANTSNIAVGQTVIMPSNSKRTFNANSDVSANGLILVNNNILQNNEVVRYQTDVGNTPIAGLTNNASYYIVDANSTGLYLSLTPSGSKITLTKGSTETGHILENQTNNDTRGIVSEIEDNKLTVINTIGHFVNGNSLNDTIIINVDSSLGVYNINKRSFKLEIAEANTPGQWLINPTVFKYDANNEVEASGIVLRANVSSNTATLFIIPTSGFFESGDFVYTSGNTSVATVGIYTGNTRGGDFVETAGANYRSLFSNVNFTVTDFSDGSGAGFKVGTIGETETLFINTDFINANAETNIDLTSRVITVSSNSGFKVGQAVSQNRSANLTPSTGINANTGVFTVSSSEPWITNNSLVVYDTNGSNAMHGLVANGYYRVIGTSGNSFNLIAVHDNKLVNNTSIPNFANIVHGSTQLIRKTTTGTIRKISSLDLTVGDVWQGPFITSANLYISTSPTTNSNVTAVSNLTYPTVNSYNFRYKKLRSAGYGLQKAPTGYHITVLNNLLTFKQLTVGTVASLTSILPGSQYNIDPYVLVQEPSISGFNRKDFVITIANATSTFLVGEKISQNLPNTDVYTYQVNNGVFDTTATSKTFNSLLDVSNSDDAIYSLINVFSFNSTLDVIDNTSFIALSNTQLFTANNKVKYVTSTGNTAVTTNNTILNVTSVNSSGISVNAVFSQSIKLVNSAAISNNYISVPSNPFANDDVVRYVTYVGNTSILGLANNKTYYVIESNSTHLRLSNTLSGSVISLTAGINETGHGLIKYNASANGNAIRLYNNDATNGMLFKYIVSAGNTAITNLTNEDNYFVVNANSYFFKLSSTFNGSPINIANVGTDVSDGHSLLYVPGFSVNDPVYTSTGSGIIRGVYIANSNSFIVVRNVTGTISNNQTITLNNNPSVNSTILSVDLEEETVTAKGIVQSANSTVIIARRIQFENLWSASVLINGETSGAQANLVSVVEDIYTRPIGLNANVQANVITAEGQITGLQVIDSGFGYSNNEIVRFVSRDNLRAGSVRVITGGVGLERGYYKTSKGFLSDDIALHDGDYYQEYSYEVFSKLSVDIYSDMFKKVMHTAGTKFFGSVLLVDEGNAAISLTESSVTGNVAG